MKDNFVVSEETDDLFGLEIANGEEENLIEIREINSKFNLDSYSYIEVFKSEIPRLIEGLKLFMEE
jgi:hypothetical protein